MQTMTITRGIVLVVGLVLVLAIAPEIAISTFSTSAAHKVRALLAPEAPVAALPRQVTVTIEGVTATYTQGTDAYEHLLGLLRLRHSDDAVEHAGSYPASASTASCGELVIRHLGLPFRCKLARSTVNPNYLRVAIPYGNGRPGYALPWIIDDNQLGKLVQNH